MAIPRSRADGGFPNRYMSAQWLLLLLSLSFVGTQRSFRRSILLPAFFGCYIQPGKGAEQRVIQIGTRVVGNVVTLPLPIGKQGVDIGGIVRHLRQIGDVGGGHGIVQ